MGTGRERSAAVVITFLFGGTRTSSHGLGEVRSNQIIILWVKNLADTHNVGFISLLRQFNDAHPTPCQRPRCPPVAAACSSSADEDAAADIRLFRAVEWRGGRRVRRRHGA